MRYEIEEAKDRFGRLQGWSRYVITNDDGSVLIIPNENVFRKEIDKIVFGIERRKNVKDIHT